MFKSDFSLLAEFDCRVLYANNRTFIRITCQILNCPIFREGFIFGEGYNGKIITERMKTIFNIIVLKGDTRREITKISEPE